ncbi:MAG: photosystem II biogenesis protein Psp29, partial [Fischerella sp.]|nr:photosystem II biogenesis protein Psp29 [Fischerella sp.]
DLQAHLQAIASNPNFKYSRLFAIGLFSLLEQSDPEFVKDEKKRTEALKTIAAGLHLSDDRLNKDLELYLSNVDKMSQALMVMADLLSADRKKREQRNQKSNTTVTPPKNNE